MHVIGFLKRVAVVAGLSWAVALGFVLFVFPVAVDSATKSVDHVLFLVRTNAPSDVVRASVFGNAAQSKQERSRRATENLRDALRGATPPRVDVVRIPAPLAAAVLASAVCGALAWFSYLSLARRRRAEAVHGEERRVSDDAWVFFSIIALVCSAPVLFAALDYWPHDHKRAYKITIAFLATGLSGIYIAVKEREYSSLGRRIEFLVTANVAGDLAVNAIEG